MRTLGRQLTFAPTDLARFSDNPYLTWMDRLHLERPGSVTPDEDPEELKIIGAMGLAHERDYLEKLRREGRSIAEIPEGDIDERIRATEAALRRGVEIVYQGALAAGSFAGVADFLVRVDGKSNLGEFRYEVQDTKLARRARPYFLLQLCCYAEMLAKVQGARPPRVVVVTGDGTERAFRTDDHFFHYLAVKDAFVAQQDAFDPEAPPEPLREGRNGRWETEAAKWLEATDHLSRVADIRTGQILKLRAAGIDTRQALAELPAGTRVPRMRDETVARLRQQARLQVDSEGLARPLYEVVPAAGDDPRRGLALLPPASPLDVAFDIEGYPLKEDGLEYLLGATVRDDGSGDGTASADGLRFVDWWAHDDRQERASFEAFLDWVYARWKRDPAMHVYHYAAYEVTAMRRLMGKYGTREREVDDLLRNEVFVDLYRVVHQGLRVGTPSYSLKKVERLYLDARTEDVATAGESIVFYQRWLENRDGDDWKRSEILRQIRDYNEVDCVSTWKLIEWLRAEQARSSVPYEPPPEPEQERNEKAVREEHEREALAREVLEGIPEDRGEGDAAERWRVRELLGWLVEFHRREDKPTWWRMFDRRDSTEEQLREDLDCLAGVTRTAREPWPEKRSTGVEYAFDPGQDTKMHVREGRDTGVFLTPDLTGATLLAMDAERGRLELKLGPKALGRLGAAGPPKRCSLIPNEYVSAGTIAQSISSVARRFLDEGKLPPALADFLHRRRPRLAGGERATGSLSAPDESPLDAARAIVPRLDGSTLCIQGPPGTGKTYTGAHVILDLLAAERRVGITTNSHKAICNLMAAVAKHAEERGQKLDAVKIGGSKDEPLLDHPGVRFLKSARDLGDLERLPMLIGGTAWVFSHPDLAGEIDTLFVDEAGQVSIANLVGMSPSATNLVLLGDQMQLGQPLQGSHPGESGKSCLDYLLQDHATVPDGLGLFLATTWRMHPDVCSFISGAVYEDRLRAEPHTKRRRIVPAGGGRIDREAGLLFVPVEHRGNRQGSPEEVEVVAELVEELRRSRHIGRDGNDAGTLTLDDILVVAPYNYQVRLLKERLGAGARVGTIDKFQGQEAPVVIVSMAASDGNESPRGIDFLFDRNRLNVALSRAQSLAIVVANPALSNTHCGTVKQMGLVNMFCRAVRTR